MCVCKHNSYEGKPREMLVGVRVVVFLQDNMMCVMLS